MYQPLQFGNVTLRGDQPFLIAEAGVNHENDLDTAFRMIEAASASGADAIKFQSYKAETLASRFSPAYWSLDAEPTTTQYELFKKFDHFGEAEYKRLAAYAEKCGIIFMSTPFDVNFVDALEPYMPFYKIASADITNVPLLRKIARKNKPVILSTGAATLGEIDSALSEIRSESDAQVALLHCVLSYPCDARDANLEIIRTLQQTYPDCIVGYSDHVPPAHECLCLTTAWLLGARIIEKHFTLDKGKPGNDHYHAFDPTDIRIFREACAYATNVLGQQRKKILQCEETPRLYARRSLVAARALKQGEVIQCGDLAVKRPGTGIPPSYLDLIVGSRPIKEIGADEVLQWSMFLTK